jgi:NAD(P)-dependent dehydrogenase (short-subunit alcohol dehydrogenase family)
MPSQGKLEGQVAIVTGGTQGIGEAVVRLFVAEGASVVVVARTPDGGDRLTEELGRSQVSFLRADVSDPNTARLAVRAAIDEFGRLDILVNNAAIDHSGVELVDAQSEDVRRVFEVNTYGAIFMLQEAARHMKAHSGGAVVNVLSRAGLVGIPGMTIYGASKGAIASLTRAAAVELSSSGIRVNAVAPGATETPMMRSWIDEQPDPVDFEHGIVANLLDERLARSDEVAEAILFLAGSSSSYVTGACLSVDGGFTAM